LCRSCAATGIKMRSRPLGDVLLRVVTPSQASVEINLESSTLQFPAE
jgi:hypothetical protein